MKKLIQLLTLSMMLAVIAVPALAQEPAASPAASPAMSQQEAEAKAALYDKIVKIIKTDQPTAYELSKEYLQKYPNDDPAIIKYLQNFVTKYAKVAQKTELRTKVDQQKWDEALMVGKQVLADDPEDLQSSLFTSWAGLNAALKGNNAANADALNYSTKTIQLIEQGKTLEAGKPYPDKDKNESLGWLNYSLYLYNMRANKPTEAASYLVKAVGHEGSVKNNPESYAQLAQIYGTQFEKLQQDYNTRFGGKDETPESKAAFERLKLAADPFIDAIARAIAYNAGTDAKATQKKTELKEALTDIYKFRYASVDGLDALIAGIKAKPLPPPPSMEMNTPSTAPATTAVPATTNSDTASGTTTGATTPATTTPSPAPPPPTTAPIKPPTATPSTTAPPTKSPTM